MTKKQKMLALIALLQACVPYDRPGADAICDLVECENCPYYKGERDDFSDLDECQKKLRTLRDSIYKAGEEGQ